MKPKNCPYCNSENILPFEDEKAYKHKYKSMVFIIATGLILIFGYILFMLISYLTFPLILFSGLFLVSKVINKGENGEKESARQNGDYICIDCNNNFKSSIKHEADNPDSDY